MADAKRTKKSADLSLTMLLQTIKIEDDVLIAIKKRNMASCRNPMGNTIPAMNLKAETITKCSNPAVVAMIL